jgi:hypothetical protein
LDDLAEVFLAEDFPLDPAPDVPPPPFDVVFFELDSSRVILRSSRSRSRFVTRPSPAIWFWISERTSFTSSVRAILLVSRSSLTAEEAC